jgi:hypothetical protein
MSTLSQKKGLRGVVACQVLWEEEGQGSRERAVTSHLINVFLFVQASWRER